MGNSNTLFQYLYSDKVEEKKELIKGITLGNKDKFQLTPLAQEVLVLWGEHDQIFPIEKGFEVARKLGPNARLEVLKDTGHMPQEEDPKRFNERRNGEQRPNGNSASTSTVSGQQIGKH